MEVVKVVMTFEEVAASCGMSDSLQEFIPVKEGQTAHRIRDVMLIVLFSKKLSFADGDMKGLHVFVF